MVSTPSYTTKHMPKPRIIDPVWGFIDEISKMSRRKLCYKEYSKETGSTTIKEHFKRDHSNAEFLKANPIEPYGKKMKKIYYDIGARTLTDNASNMIVFGNMLNEILQLKYDNIDFEQVRCAAHVLNLAVSDGMQNSITKLRNFEQYPTDEDWIEIESASSYPTMGDLHMVFPVILNILNDSLITNNNNPISIKNKQMYVKLNDYWIIIKNSCCTSVVLNPNVKLSSFDKEMALKVHSLMRNIYSKYEDKQSNPNLNMTESCNTSGAYFKKHLKVLLC
ncbi:hypothetical protein RCL_jg18740.t1 [Rhizophagus clarus]|uniref:hAT-like transposase RNase-H fold domain-containing protein n=1 Tax=Rhizophagus clarus TaxID=94130 RepID=A0A8H3R317_9GLOM|nr:hypothetical protein RCL_jg18740.t1 [Rhizophagus clarus]